jgi:VanZ family protein
MALVAVALAGLYGLSDEWHQMYVPHRVAEMADVMKDLGGAVAGAALFHALGARLARKEVAR